MADVSIDQFFQHSEEAHGKINSGEIIGITRWPELEGVCELIKASPTRKGAHLFLEFFLRHDQLGVGKFGVFMPNLSQKDFAIASRMDQLYGTLYGVSGASVKKHSPKEAFLRLSKKLEQGAVQCRYKLTERESESPKNGKIYTNQDLAFLKEVPSELSSENSGFSL